MYVCQKRREDPRATLGTGTLQKNLSDKEGKNCSDLTEEKQKSGEDVHFGPPLIFGVIQYHETQVGYLLKCLQGVAKGDPMYLDKS